MKKTHGLMILIRDMWSYIPLYMIFFYTLKIITALMPILKISITAAFLDTAMLIYEGKTSFQTIYGLIFAFFLLTTVQWTLEGVSSLLFVKIKNIIEAKEDLKIINKVNSLPYDQLERTEIQNIIDRIKTSALEKITTTIMRVGDIINLLIRIIGIFYLIFEASKLSAVVVLLSFIPMLIFAVKSGDVQYSLEKSFSEDQRYADYLSNLMTNREAACERQLFGYGEKLNLKWKTISLTVIKAKRIKKVLWYAKTKASAVMILFSTIITGVMLLKPFFNGTISSGFYISIMSALIELIGIMTMDFSTVFDELSQNLAFICDYLNFYRMPEVDRKRDSGIIISSVDSIEFRNVSFSYPGSNEQVLKHISFQLKKGQSYALVGTNGAGKSTIVKLILQLYQSYDGDILVNGQNIKDINRSSLLKQYAVVFQDFCQYPITLRENITLTDEMNAEDKMERTGNELGIGQLVSKLPNGYDTEFGKIQSEEDISGGEWQRIAIARAMVRESDVQILDEPTASLDPVHEGKLYAMFQRILKRQDKLSLVITHRLGASKESDSIMVLDAGKIIETGDFEELTAKRGLYFEMFNAQSKWYIH